MCQTYKPDKRSGYLPVPLTTDPSYRGYDTGVKIVTGLQILLKSAKGKVAKLSGSNLSKFLEQLKSNGYFGNELENSRRWTELYNKALDYYKQNEIAEISNDSFRAQCAKSVLKLRSEYEKDAIINFETDRLEVDNLDWLNIDEREFDKKLKERYDWTNDESANFSNRIDDLEEMTKSMKNFVKQTSDFEGVDPDSNTDEINIDPSKFGDAFSKLLGMPKSS